MRLSCLYSLTLISLFSFAIGAFAATDPIAEFCASPTAQADAAARQQCSDYVQSLANSNVKKTEKDEAQAAINKINADIKIAEQKIKIQNTIISKLSKDIGAKSEIVSSLEARIDTNTESIANLMRKLSMKDTISFPEMLLGHARFSDFYTEVDEYVTLSKEINTLVDEVKSRKNETQSEKEVLENRKDRESDAKAAIEAEKRLIDRKKIEKSAILALKTTEYNVTQKILSDQKQKVAQIRARLFKFQDGEGISFGDAYDFAVKASQKTGVRPALILGVLAQESSQNEDGLFGTNIGSCYVRNITTGDGVGKNSGRAFERIMYSATDTKRPSDTVPFLDITTRLGRDWMNTAVSCPPDPRGNGKYYSGRGFGGGMGATQFIPSTWELMKKKVGNFLGISGDDVDPWNYGHAIMAAATLLRDSGATSGATYSAERNAACKYYSGAKCTLGRKPANVFYGDQVMRKAADYQDDIDAISGR
jgi:membrane-bound lytic murein transglycosylase B